jgi:hypothetical protein
VKDKKRALRRHHAERLKRKRARYWTAVTERQRAIAVNTPCRCSCWMCGNPRRHWGEKTVQEQRADAIEDESGNEITILSKKS